jgi:hypothetical protein
MSLHAPASPLLALSLLACAALTHAQAPPRPAAADSPAASAAGSGGAKRALLIGINDYRAVPALFGSLNDVAAMQEVLTTRWGFPRANVRVLTDAAATRAGVFAALNQLVRDTRPGDVVYVHYSGHGSQVEDLNGDEQDGLDETLVPYDGRTGSVPDITDDELDAVFARLRSADAVIVLDSCHSGTATRALEIRTRSVPRDMRTELYRSSTTQTRAIVPVASARYVVMSAAASDQEALDGPVDGRYHGFFSYALARSIGAAPAGASAREVFAGIAAQLARIKAQFARAAMPEPQLEAPPAKLDRPLLPGERPPARVAWVETRSSGAGEVRLLRGAALGATVGSRWALFPPGEQQFAPGRALGVVTVVRIDSADAVAGVAAPAPASARAIPDGARAIAVMPPGGGRIAVRVRDVPPERRREIEAILARDIRNVRLVGPNEPAQFVVDESQGNVRLLTADGLQLIASFAGGSTDWGGNAAAQIARIATAAELLSLDNPAAQLRVTARIADSQPFATRGVALVPDLAPTRYRIRRAGEPRDPRNSLQLEIAVSQDAYVTIVDVDSEGRVNLLFPNEYQKSDFHPEGFVRAGIPARIPDDLRSGNRAGFHWDYGPPAGADTIRVFASTDLALARLVRERVRAMQGSDVTSGIESLRTDLAGVAARGITTVADRPGAAAGDWAAATVTVQVEE